MRLFKNNKGATSIEYGLLVAIIGSALIAGLSVPVTVTNGAGQTINDRDLTIGGELYDIFYRLGDTIGAANNCHRDGNC